jgi:hypothetical protein
MFLERIGDSVFYDRINIAWFPYLLMTEGRNYFFNKISYGLSPLAFQDCPNEKPSNVVEKILKVIFYNGLVSRLVSLFTIFPLYFLVVNLQRLSGQCQRIDNACLAWVLSVVPLFFKQLFMLLVVLITPIIKPRLAYNIANRYDDWLGALSILYTTFAYIALFVFMGPLLGLVFGAKGGALAGACDAIAKLPVFSQVGSFAASIVNWLGISAASSSVVVAGSSVTAAVVGRSAVCETAQLISRRGFFSCCSRRDRSIEDVNDQALLAARDNDDELQVSPVL